jgi:hypothetical protein
VAAPDDYATTTLIAATKLRFRFNNLASIVRNVHDCARAVRLIDQAYERATVFPRKPGHDSSDRLARRAGDAR